ncbi:hypothetical protein QE152_g7606 [Popillia japonica]|uniref:Uncharacterized protein n=1 Tax=Popillia japonica TaxID=7064 RepID=A0AAW1MFR6_POPJA
MGVVGACRCCKLMNLKVSDVQTSETSHLVGKRLITNTEAYSSLKHVVKVVSQKKRCSSFVSKMIRTSYQRYQ